MYNGVQFEINYNLCYFVSGLNVVIVVVEFEYVKFFVGV